ncbi:MAG TPA: hypothetical protein VF193_16805 [Steroidobacter sp.]
MILKLKDIPTHVVRPRVTPDPERAAELERRMSSLSYYPENGFHRDRRQPRLEHIAYSRLALQR